MGSGNVDTKSAKKTPAHEGKQGTGAARGAGQATHADASGNLDVPQGPARYYNRELSWLQFNKRVLGEAMNTRQPLLERLRFLSISASNLDEFFMVRAAGVFGQIVAGVSTKTQDGLSPQQQMAAINETVSELVAEKQAVWRKLVVEMADAGLHIV